MPERTFRFGRRMSEQDALLWTIEGDPLLRSTIISVAILDRSPSRDHFMALAERATHLVPRLRQRVVEVPANLAPPLYSVDPYFDLTYHVRWDRLRGRATMRQVLDYAAALAVEPFDRARPLWRMVVLPGLEDGRAALIQKLHHSLADGVGAMRISMAFLDSTRRLGRVEPMPTVERDHLASGELSPLGQLRDGLTYRLGRQVRGLSKMPQALMGSVTDPLGTVRTAGSAVRLLRPVSAPLSPLMTGRSLGLRLDTLTSSLSTMKAASKIVGGRLNDAFVAAMAGGLDRYHRAHDRPVSELRMTMPINIRPRHGGLAGGNQFVPARFAFPVSVGDPVERMRRLKAEVEAQRAEPALNLAAPIAGLLNRLPGALTTSLFGGMLKGIDVVTSNVPGSPVPVYISGGKVEATFGYGPLSGAACNITLLSYQDDLHLSVATDPAAVPDPDCFVQCLADGLAEIEKLTE